MQTRTHREQLKATPDTLTMVCSPDQSGTLVPLVRRLPDCYVLTLSIHNQRSVEYYCNSLPIGNGESTLLPCGHDSERAGIVGVGG